MSYTVLRVENEGVALYAQHLGRFERSGDAAQAAFRAFAAEATPGIYRLSWEDGRLCIERREGTSLFEGIPVRYLPSPLDPAAGAIPKAPPPNAYSALRQPGVATLLTSPDGTELYESCTASLIEWEDGFIAPPEGRPLLLSTTMRALLSTGRVRRAPILRNSRRPLALINAVAGLIVPKAERDAFPSEGRAQFDAMWRSSTRRP